MSESQIRGTIALARFLQTAPAKCNELATYLTDGAAFANQDHDTHHRSKHAKRASWRAEGLIHHAHGITEVR